MPAILFNKQSGKLEDVPEEQIQNLYASGNYAIPMVDPDGNRQAVDPTDAAKFVGMGWHQPDPDKLSAYKAEKDKQDILQERYGGVTGAFEATLQGAMRGATAGYSDPIQTAFHAALGIGQGPEEREALKQIQPAASTVGEGIGIVGPVVAALATGGASVAAEAAAAGETVGSLSEGVSLASKLAELGKRLAVGSTVGGAAGAGQALSEADLGETQLTAEKLGSAITLGAIFGAGTEGAFALGERLLPKAVEGLSDGLSKLKDSLSTRAKIEGIETDIRGLARQRADALNETFASLKEASLDATHNGRPAEIADQLINHDVAASKAGAVVTLDRAQARIGLLIEDTSPTAYGVAKVSKSIDKARLELEGADTSVEVYQVMNNFKERVKDFTKAGGNPTAEEGKAVMAHTDIYSEIRNLLEDPESFGKAAVRTKEYNSALHDVLNSKDVLAERLGMTEKLDTFRPYKSVTSSKVETELYNSALKNTAGDPVNEALSAFTTNLERYTNELKKTYQGAALKPPDMEHLEAMWGRAQEMRSQGMDSVSRLGEMQKIGQGGGSRTPGAIIGGVIGHMTGIPHGGMAGALIGGALSGGGKQLETLARLAGVADKVNQAIGAKIGAFLGSQTARGVAEAQIGRLMGDQQQKKVAEIDQMMSSPERMADTLDRRFGSRVAEAAPNLTMAMKAEKVSGLRFLQIKAPRSSSHSGFVKPRGSVTTPRSMQLKFERYHRAINNKLTVLDDLASHRLTSDAVEAFSTVSPVLYSTVLAEVMQQIADRPNLELSTKQQAQLATLFQEPVSDATTPEFMAMVQKNFQTDYAAPQPNAGGRPPTQGGLDKLRADDKTETQRLETRAA